MEQAGTHERGDNLVSTFETGTCQPQALPNRDEVMAVHGSREGRDRTAQGPVCLLCPLQLGQELHSFKRHQDVPGGDCG